VGVEFPSGHAAPACVLLAMAWANRQGCCRYTAVFIEHGFTAVFVEHERLHHQPQKDTVSSHLSFHWFLRHGCRFIGF
jgi:hypothetical protein